MGVQAVQLSSTGFIPNITGLGKNLSQQLPEFVLLQTSDTLSTVLVSGYLNHSRTYFQFPYNSGQMALVSTSDAGCVWLKVVVTNPGLPTATYSLAFPTETATGNPVGFTGTLTAGNLVSVNNANGTVQDSAITASNVMQINAINIMAAGGRITLAKVNGTEAANAVTTAAGNSGVITTSALTTAGGASYAITWTNSALLSTSVIQLTLMGGTNTTKNITLQATAGSGTSTLTIYNNTAATALNGTILIGYTVL